MKTESHIYFGQVEDWLWHWLKEKNVFFKMAEAEKADGQLRSLNYLSDLSHCQLFEIWTKHSASFEYEEVGLLLEKLLLVCEQMQP